MNGFVICCLRGSGSLARVLVASERRPDFFCFRCKEDFHRNDVVVSTKNGVERFHRCCIIFLHSDEAIEADIALNQQSRSLRRWKERSKSRHNLL